MTDIAKLEKMARMALFDVPLTQIAKAISVSDETITELMNTDTYQNILAEITTEYFEQNQGLNDGWNSIEALALTQVIETLKWTKDPDYALRAATMANRASRRGDVKQQPIDGQTGARAVINLTANFIDKLQQFNVEHVNGNGNGKIVNNEPAQKESDFMVPEKVEKLFVAPRERIKKPEDILNFFPEIDMAAVE